MPQPFYGLVVRVDKPGQDTRGQGRSLAHEAVVLAGNEGPPCKHIPDRVVRAMMAELHFGGLSSEGEGQYLMAQADADSG